MNNTTKFINFFINGLKESYKNLSTDDLTLIDNVYINRLKKLSKNKTKLKCLSSIGYLGIYGLLFAVVGTPFIFSILDLITTEQAEKVSKYVNTGTTIFLAIWKIVYDYIGYPKRIFIHEQTLLRLKKEGVKFLNKDEDKRYKKRIIEKDKLRKFVSKVKSKLDMAIVKYEKHMNTHYTDNKKVRKDIKVEEINDLSFGSYGNDFFNIEDLEVDIPSSNDTIIKIEPISDEDDKL